MRSKAALFVQGIEKTVGFGKGANRLYASNRSGKALVGRNRIIRDEPKNPQWYVSFHIYCANQAGNVVFSVKDDKPIGANGGRKSLCTCEGSPRWPRVRAVAPAG